MEVSEGDSQGQKDSEESAEPQGVTSTSAGRIEVIPRGVKGVQALSSAGLKAASDIQLPEGLFPGGSAAIAQMQALAAENAKVGRPLANLAGIAQAPALVEAARQATRALGTLTPIFPVDSSAIFKSLELESYQQIVDNLADTWKTLFPSFEGLISLRRDVDWASWAERYEAWGNYGWCIPDGMSFDDIRAVPTSLVEADKAGRRFLDREATDSVAELIRQDVRKKKDFAEAVELLQERRYKPCAMMLCSLVENELMTRDLKTKDGRRGLRRPLEKRGASMPPDGLVFLGFRGMCKVVDHYFGYGHDFDHSYEGDLNRNFLMHGMMSKRVTRTVCLKLMLLLEEILTDM